MIMEIFNLFDAAEMLIMLGFPMFLHDSGLLYISDAFAVKGTRSIRIPHSLLMFWMVLGYFILLTARKGKCSDTWKWGAGGP